MESETRIICDFCSSPDVVYRYPCYDDSIIIEGNGVALGLGSIGDWASCEACSSLIDTDNREGLVNRSIVTYTDISDGRLTSYDITDMMQVIHAMFWRRRHGQKICITGRC